MDLKEFQQLGHECVDWITEYFETIETFPVKSQVAPKDILQQLSEAPPTQSESFTDIFQDFQNIMMPGITHWQHPSFFAFFPANTSYPSILAEMLTAAIAPQCMVWQTSPAAAELEERMMQWLRDMLGLPGFFEGVIQDTASTATLCALISAREKLTDYRCNQSGLQRQKILVVYTSSQAHSSVEKGAKIAGFGADNVRKVDVDQDFTMKPEHLESLIKQDIANGVQPLCVVATLGTTGSTAIDPLKPIADICKKYGVWLHVDAAFAGTALVLPEMRWMIEGIELADSFVFNPHKWMFVNFDCSAYFVKDREGLMKTFEILPEYLKAKEGKTVNDYRDWGIQLGRRFRALKLWFVIRSFGVVGIQDKIRLHLKLAKGFATNIRESRDFELMAPVPLATVCFRYKPDGDDDVETLNAGNMRLMEALNATGKLYLTHTKLGSATTLRLSIGQTHTAQRHVDAAWKMIQSVARQNFIDIS